MLKRIISLIMTLCLAIGIVSCNKGEKTEQASNVQKTLTIELKTNDRLFMISEFEKKHPDIKVQVKEHEADPSQLTSEIAEEYQKAINSGLLAGGGADVIEVSRLPYEKYAKKNVLANMSKLIENDSSFDINNYQQNILETCKYKGNLYAMPISFRFNKFGVNKNIKEKEGLDIDSTKWTWKDFLSISQKITKDLNGDGTLDQYALPKMSSMDIFLGLIFRSEYLKLINFEKKTCNFDSKEFIDILNLTKEFKEKNVCSPTMDFDKLHEMKDSGTIGFNDYYVGDYQDVIQAQAINNGEVEYIDMPSYSGEKEPDIITLYTIFAINNNSKSKTEAWEFIKFLLSDEVQSRYDIFGFPVNKKVLKEKAKAEISHSGMYQDYKNLGRKVKPLTQTDVDMVNKMMDELDAVSYYSYESKVREIIYKGVEEFFSGKKTAEQTAKLLQNRITIYLNE